MKNYTLKRKIGLFNHYYNEKRQHHRINGPAIEDFYGSYAQYVINGKQLTEEEFKRITKPYNTKLGKILYDENYR